MKRCLLLVVSFISATLLADGIKDNQMENVRPVPPPGVAIAASERAELEQGVAALGKEIEAVRTALKGKPALEFLPDVQIYHKAVDWALRYDEFFRTNEVGTARQLLKQGMERATQLREGKTPWLTGTGLVARGYLSKIDGSIQPYGLVIPAGVTPNSTQPYRLDFWIHGRGETLSELSFVDQRQKSAGEFTPSNAIVLHLYGRYCCANKLAGEMDLFEALASVKKTYPIDPNRLVVRGFSMGGAACWQFATHYGGFWAAAAPGAGFSETPDFLKVFQQETLQPKWYEKKLWHLYDGIDYAVNLFNLPTVAYSGELDSQKQAADMMTKALKAEGIELTHIIGPGTKHAYEKNAKVEVARRIDALAAVGRDPAPRKVKFTTWTLRYNEQLWVTIDGMEEHWERARVDAEILNDTSVSATTLNVSALSFHMEPGLCPLDPTHRLTVRLDGQKLETPPPSTDRSWTVHFRRDGKKWVLTDGNPGTSLVKRHGLQGPIDDAFLDSFLMVRPTGQPMNAKVGAWAAGEMAHALKHWRQQYRGEARVKDDSAITDEDIANNNLVLWGDPSSNKLLARMADKLPIRWTSAGVQVGKQMYPAANNVAVMIYPNPLNPQRYVVLNSGFTFREYDYLNNARQNAKLPDWAIVDVNTPSNSRWPGEVVNADFFGEKWELKAARK